MIFCLISSIWSANFSPSAFSLPSPTPSDLRSKIWSSPPLKVPSWAALAVSNTDTSTFFCAEVRMWSPR